MSILFPTDFSEHSAKTFGFALDLAKKLNETITLVKDTSLVYVLALNDLLRATRNIVQRDFNVTPFLTAAAFYLIMTLILTWMFQYMEKRYAVYED